MKLFQFLEDTPSLYQAFFWVAVGASLLFILQTLAFLMGGDSGSASTETDFGGGDTAGSDMPFQMFTVRNLVNFLLGFGWAGVTFFNKISSSFVLVAVAAIIGILFVLFFFFIIKQFLKLTEDNTFDFKNLVGVTGDVYLPIPAKMAGKGKVIISVKGASHELPAMTGGEAIATGETIKVERIEDNTLIVNKIAD